MTWTMYYGPHAVYEGISWEKVQDISQHWDAALAGGHAWFTVETLDPVTAEHASARLRAFRDAPIAFIPD